MNYIIQLYTNTVKLKKPQKTNAIKFSSWLSDIYIKKLTKMHFLLSLNTKTQSHLIHTNQIKFKEIEIKSAAVAREREKYLKLIIHSLTPSEDWTMNKFFF